MQSENFIFKNRFENQDYGRNGKSSNKSNELILKHKLE